MSSSSRVCGSAVLQCLLLCGQRGGVIRRHRKGAGLQQVGNAPPRAVLGEGVGAVDVGQALAALCIAAPQRGDDVGVGEDHLLGEGQGKGGQRDEGMSEMKV
jgi:hypothetical protein